MDKNQNNNFPIDELQDYHIELWLRIYTKTKNVEDIKHLMRTSTEAIELNKKLNWE